MQTLDSTNLMAKTTYNGDAKVKMTNGKVANIKHRPFFLHNLLHVPRLSNNLFSVSQFARGIIKFTLSSMLAHAIFLFVVIMYQILVMLITICFLPLASEVRTKYILSALIPSINGSIYCIHFMDAYSKFTWIYLIDTKSQALSCFVHFQTMMEYQLRTIIKAIQLNSGKEYRPFTKYLNSFFIIHRFSCPYTMNKMVLKEEA
ncbi:hypothetical protein CR513_27545, partial [Mucuna pruriens]